MQRWLFGYGVDGLVRTHCINMCLLIVHMHRDELEQENKKKLLRALELPAIKVYKHKE